MSTILHLAGACGAALLALLVFGWLISFSIWWDDAAAERRDLRRYLREERRRRDGAEP